MRKLKLMNNPDVNKSEDAKAVKDEVKPYGTSRKTTCLFGKR